MSKVHKLLSNPHSIINYLAGRGLLKWLPDRLYLKLLYRARMGKILNLNTPRTFTEKQQWLKLNDRDPRYSVLVDKHLVKGFVREQLGAEFVVPTLGVWNNASLIDFEALPNEFVLKVNHNSGGVLICTDKKTFDKEHAVSFLNAHLKKNYYWWSREWPYRGVKPLVFAEKYLPSDGDDTSSPGREESTTRKSSAIVDYKFFCFNGEPRFLSIQHDLDDPTLGRFSFLKLDWTRAEFRRREYLEFEEILPKPECFDQMIETARTLSAGVPFVRVDLFEFGGQVLFSEMTFFPTAGMTALSPEGSDFQIGQYLNIDWAVPRQ